MQKDLNNDYYQVPFEFKLKNTRFQQSLTQNSNEQFQQNKLKISKNQGMNLQTKDNIERIQQELYSHDVLLKDDAVKLKTQINTFENNNQKQWIDKLLFKRKMVLKTIPASMKDNNEIGLYETLHSKQFYNKHQKIIRVQEPNQVSFLQDKNIKVAKKISLMKGLANPNAPMKVQMQKCKNYFRNNINKNAQKSKDKNAVQQIQCLEELGEQIEKKSQKKRLKQEIYNIKNNELDDNEEDNIEEIDNESIQSMTEVITNHQKFLDEESALIKKKIKSDFAAEDNAKENHNIMQKMNKNVISKESNMNPDNQNYGFYKKQYFDKKQSNNQEEEIDIFNEQLKNQVRWKDISNEPNQFVPQQIIPFDVKLNKILISELELCEIPIVFYQEIMTDRILQLIIDRTNSYASYKSKKLDDAIKKLNKKKYYFQTVYQKWENMDITELKGVIAIQMFKGLVQIGQGNFYFKDDIIYGKFLPKNIMKEYRFSLILKYMRFYDIREQSKNQLIDPIWKIRPLINIIVSQSQKLYYPSKNICVDEGMIQYRGNHFLKRYMPKKPTPHGFKAYIMAESQSSYMYNWFIYPNDVAQYEGRYYERIVIHLVQPIKNRGHFIFSDRYYTSLNLFTKLYEMGFGASGTIQFSRLRFNKEITQKIIEMEFGQTKWLKVDYNYGETTCQILCVVWFPKALGLLITTWDQTGFYELEKVGKVKVQSQSKKYIWQKTIQRIPMVIHNYNQNKGGVDSLDGMLNFARHQTIDITWYTKIAWYMFELAIINSYILYKKSLLKYLNVHPKLIYYIAPQKKISNVSYRKCIIGYLAKDQIERESLKYYSQHDKICILIRSSCILGISQKLQVCKICQKRMVDTMCLRHKENVCIIPCYDIHWKQSTLLNIAQHERFQNLLQIRKNKYVRAH